MSVARMEYTRNALSFWTDSFKISLSGVLSNWCFKSAYVHHNSPVPTKRAPLLKIKSNTASSQEMKSFKMEAKKTLFLHMSLNVYIHKCQIHRLCCAKQNMARFLKSTWWILSNICLVRWCKDTSVVARSYHEIKVTVDLLTEQWMQSS